MTTTGIRASSGVARIERSTSSPSMRGILRSSSTKLGIPLDAPGERSPPMEVIEGFSIPSRTRSISLSRLAPDRASAVSSASRSLSSTRRSRLMPTVSMVSGRLGARREPDSVQGQIDRRPLPGGAFRPGATPVPGDDSPHQGEADPGPLELVGPVQPLENAEELVGKPWIESGPVVADEQDGQPSSSPAQPTSIRADPGPA